MTLDDGPYRVTTVLDDGNTLREKVASRSLANSRFKMAKRNPRAIFACMVELSDDPRFRSVIETWYSGGRGVSAHGDLKFVPCG